MVSTIRRVVLVAAIAAVILGLPVSGAAAANTLTGAIFTTNSTGTAVNQNQFFVKEEVFLNGGPQHPGGPGLPPGKYYFQVTDPSGRTLLSSDAAECRQLTVNSSGRVSGVVDTSCEHAIGTNPNVGEFSPNGATPVQLFPFNDSPNKGGTYKVWLIPQTGVVTGCTATANGAVVTFRSNCARTDNFSVKFSEATPACAAWQETFSGKSLDELRWIIDDRPAPGSSATNQGFFVPANVSVGNGLLTLTMTQTPIGQTQETIPQTIWSSLGGSIRSRVACGHGTYEWTMRMGSLTNSSAGTGTNLSGGISAGFTYANNSEHEINFEHTAHTSAGSEVPPNTPPKGQFSPEAIWFVNFKGECCETNHEHELPDVYNVFHHYKFVWEPGKITYYVDGVVEFETTENVPVINGFVHMSHFGRNFRQFGGLATEGTRYFFVRRFAYTPLK